MISESLSQELLEGELREELLSYGVDAEKGKMSDGQYDSAMRELANRQAAAARDTSPESAEKVEGLRQVLAWHLHQVCPLSFPIDLRGLEAGMSIFTAHIWIAARVCARLTRTFKWKDPFWWAVDPYDENHSTKLQVSVEPASSIITLGFWQEGMNSQGRLHDKHPDAVTQSQHKSI